MSSYQKMFEFEIDLEKSNNQFPAKEKVLEKFKEDFKEHLKASIIKRKEESRSLLSSEHSKQEIEITEEVTDETKRIEAADEINFEEITDETNIIELADEDILEEEIIEEPKYDAVDEAIEIGLKSFESVIEEKPVQSFKKDKKKKHKKKSRKR